MLSATFAIKRKTKVSSPTVLHNPTPLAINLAPLEMESIEEQMDGGPNLQVVINNLERLHESDPHLDATRKEPTKDDGKCPLGSLKRGVRNPSPGK